MTKWDTHWFSKGNNKERYDVMQYKSHSMDDKKGRKQKKVPNQKLRWYVRSNDKHTNTTSRTTRRYSTPIIITITNL
jgi:hypothetical protein